MHRMAPRPSPSHKTLETIKQAESTRQGEIDKERTTVLIKIRAISFIVLATENEIKGYLKLIFQAL